MITIMSVTVSILVASIWDIQKGLSVWLIFAGLEEIINAKKYYDVEKRKAAFVCLGIGIFCCTCGIISLTNII